jgi:uncharacterized protein (DUF427 family)
MKATMKATWKGEVIAESNATREVDGYRYFPRESVRMELLRKAPKTAEDRECPNGVQFYDLVQGAATSPRAAWSYEQPAGSITQIGRWIGFWQDVEVS